MRFDYLIAFLASKLIEIASVEICSFCKIFEKIAIFSKFWWKIWFFIKFQQNRFQWIFMLKMRSSSQNTSKKSYKFVGEKIMAARAALQHVRRTFLIFTFLCFFALFASNSFARGARAPKNYEIQKVNTKRIKFIHECVFISPKLTELAQCEHFLIFPKSIKLSWSWFNPLTEPSFSEGCILRKLRWWLRFRDFTA